MAEEMKEAAPLASHLRELRKRILVCIVAAGVGFLVSYAFSERIYGILAMPLIPALPPGYDYLVFTGVVEPFFVYMKVGFLGGVVLASPVILYELWGFIAPGLYEKERLWFLVTVLSSLFLFVCGILFAFFVVFSFGFRYLLGYASADLRPIISMSSYFSLVTRLLIAFGIIYQLPLAMLVLARAVTVTPGQFVSWWRYALVGIFAVSAIVTPTPDVFNQFLMAGPLIVLYGVGLVLAKLLGKKRGEDKV